ncbi:hypothetical protein IEQ34_019302 [Dendrobium chrysotoxum]|uniref:Uncharacterized protein n=1 Tax=Dendrobium chrysotoxum TaxID=161865 RepID=A0AAV7G877_DENCH|nr:hypothetical protein IEQ34_019302 [Dendrobium chrysotoxum]
MDQSRLLRSSSVVYSAFFVGGSFARRSGVLCPLQVEAKGVRRFSACFRRKRKEVRFSASPCGEKEVFCAGFSALLWEQKESHFRLVQYPEGRLRGVDVVSVFFSFFRNAAEKGMQASNLYLAKAWFHSSQPMTRSRSSELRRRYAAMQSSQMATIAQEPNNIPLDGTNKIQLEFTNANSFGSIQMVEMSNQMHSLMSPSNSSTSFNTPQIAKPDKVSSVVCMLKGTLERKKLNNRGDKEVMEGSSYGMLGSHEAVPNIRTDQGFDSHVAGSLTSFHMVSPMKVTSSGNLASVEKSLEPSMESFPTLANQTRMVAASRELSQSESSTVAPALSTGFEACDGPAHSGHTIYNGVISSRPVGNGPSDHELKVNGRPLIFLIYYFFPHNLFSHDQSFCGMMLFIGFVYYWDRTFENRFNDARKQFNILALVAFHDANGQPNLFSLALNAVDRADPTKKRRVERSRKMAKAKERNSTPPLPSDMQAVLKRFETLEKEVRSLKLNLSFMNRKDSEQTKQIEELQKQNDELVNEKEQLLEEIERIISDSGKM